MKKLVIFLFLLLLPAGCITTKYGVGTKMIYYDGVHDSTKVYVHSYRLFWVEIRDTQIINDTTIIGITREKYLHPIK